MSSVVTEKATRRDLLRASATAGTVGLAGCLEESLASAPTPEPGTWPLVRYGPRNTARAPDASPPTDPTVEQFSTTGRATSIVVGGTGETRRIVVGGYHGLTAHRPDGTAVWEGRKADSVAVRPGSDVCYAAGETLRALTLTDGTVRWSTDPSAPSYGIVPSSRGPFVPFNGGIDMYDRDGDRRYRITRGEGFGNAGVAVADDVYVTDVGMVERLSSRGVLRRLRDEPPAAAWRVERGLGFGYVPIVDEGEMYVTNEGEHGSDGGVLALDTDGNVRWNRSLGWRPQGGALGPDRLFVAMSHSGDSDESRLYALRRTDGTTDWTVSDFDGDDGYYADPVVAGDRVLVGDGILDDSGHVAAYTLDGDRQWRQRLDSEVWDIAPVGDRIYAVTKSGSLYVLS